MSCIHYFNDERDKTICSFANIANMMQNCKYPVYDYDVDTMTIYMHTSTSIRCRSMFKLLPSPWVITRCTDDDIHYNSEIICIDNNIMACELEDTSDITAHNYIKNAVDALYEFTSFYLIGYQE